MNLALWTYFLLLLPLTVITATFSSPDVLIAHTDDALIRHNNRRNNKRRGSLATASSFISRLALIVLIRYLESATLQATSVTSSGVFRLFLMCSAVRLPLMALPGTSSSLLVLLHDQCLPATSAVQAFLAR